VVPKPLWSRKTPADDRNRILLAMRSVLVDHPDGPVLIETGLGNKEDAKFHDIYGVENGLAGRTLLEDALEEAGYRPEDIRWVINTHLHFDHAGGNSRLTIEDWRLKHEPSQPSSILTHQSSLHHHLPLSFPNATYVVQEAELEFARHPNERTQASYFPRNFEPVAEAGRWSLTRGDQPVLPGIAVRLTPGHVPFHQSVLIQDGGETTVYLGDILPTVAHLPLVYIMGYDLEPLRTLETKRGLLREASEKGWWFLFGHDPWTIRGRVVPEGKSVGLADVLARAPGLQVDPPRSVDPGSPAG
jgi:glyoxylase-like metal-dependent hydrolase (beta-lactamase superfamily II)